MPIRPFRYIPVEDADPISREWEVKERSTARTVGYIRELAANNYAAKRHGKDADYHGTHGCRRDAARWLRDHLTDSTNYDGEP